MRVFSDLLSTWEPPFMPDSETNKGYASTPDIAYAAISFGAFYHTQRMLQHVNFDIRLGIELSFF